MHRYSNDMKQTLSLAIPVVIGQLGHMMMGVVDSIMVGRIGAAPLAAASLANGLFWLFMIVGFGVSMAISPLVAMAIGAGKKDECGLVFRQGLIVNVALGIFLMIATIIGANLLRFLDQPAEVVAMAIPYMRTLGLSIIPVMIFQTYRQFIEGLSVMRPAMIITVLANIVNIFGNWVFIFGNLGMPALGLTGAGWSTFVTRLVMTLAISLYVMRSGQFKSFDPTLRFRGFDRNVIRKILRIGIPGGIQYFFELGAFTGAVIIIGWLGTNELAAHQIAINLASITFMFAMGFSAAGSIRVGNAVGRKDVAATRRAGFSAIMLSALVMGCFGILFVTLRDFFPTLYIEDLQVIEIASTLVIIAGFFQIFDGIQAVGIGVLRGAADVRIPTIITFIAYWLVGLPIGYLLGFIFRFGVQGIWTGLLLALACSATLLTLRFNRITKHKIIV